ncbi:hypothetical protein AB6A40_011481, partial [Gnathostoma spinigerum]
MRLKLLLCALLFSQLLSDAHFSQQIKKLKGQEELLGWTELSGDNIVKREVDGEITEYPVLPTGKPQYSSRPPYSSSTSRPPYSSSTSRPPYSSSTSR